MQRPYEILYECMPLKTPSGEDCILMMNDHIETGKPFRLLERNNRPDYIKIDEKCCWNLILRYINELKG